jgi:hypothetical protein
MAVAVAAMAAAVQVSAGVQVSNFFKGAGAPAPFDFFYNLKIFLWQNQPQKQ